MSGETISDYSGKADLNLLNVHLSSIVQDSDISDKKWQIFKIWLYHESCVCYPKSLVFKFINKI